MENARRVRGESPRPTWLLASPTRSDGFLPALVARFFFAAAGLFAAFAAWAFFATAGLDRISPDPDAASRSTSVVFFRAE